MASTWMIVAFLGLAAVGLPVCASMGIGALVGIALLNLPFDTFPRYMLADVRSVPLLAVPFFILAGNLMNGLGLSRRIFDFIQAVIGAFVAGLAQVTVLTSVVFAGISGSALADIAGLGTLQIETMKRAGYRAEFAASLTIASSLLAPIIPPSIMFIIYAVMMNVSVGQMFIAGILPGLTMAVVLFATNYVLAKTGWEKMPLGSRSSGREMWKAFWRALPALLTPVVILRSMTTGLVTPTEASVLAVLYSLGLGLFYRELTWPVVKSAFTTTARTTTLIMFLTGLGSVMSFVLTSDQVAEHLSSHLGVLAYNKWTILCAITAALILLGCFMETVPAMLVSIPLFAPLILKFGIDPLHFGVVLTYALLLGIVHPPVGLGLFTVCAVSRLKIEAVTAATFKFYPAFLIVLALYMFVPALSTWLPSVAFPSK
jgi:tripartite ATP-independent transporter DctM subunit